MFKKISYLARIHKRVMGKEYFVDDYAKKYKKEMT